jgi:excisionase family DNA binding protein
MRGRKVAEDFLTVAQAAEVIGCTEGRVRQLIREGKISGIQELSERIRLIPRSQAEKLRDIPHTVGRPRISA